MTANKIKEFNILKHSLLAQWHMNSATNGHCEKRVVRTGKDNHLLTKEELRDNSMECSLRHINIIDEIINSK